MKVFREIKAHKNLSRYTKGVGLGRLSFANVLRLSAVFLLPVALRAKWWVAAVALCLFYAVLIFVTNSVSVRVFTRLHIFPRIDMTKKVLCKKAPALDFRREIEGNVATKRGLVEEGIFGVVFGAVFGALSIAFSLYFSLPVGICAAAGLLSLLPSRQHRPNDDEKAFFESAFEDTLDAERKLAQFSALPRQKIRAYRIDRLVLLRLAAFGAVCLGGAHALFAYAYFELSLYFFSLLKRGKSSLTWQMRSLEQIDAFLTADWEDAR